MLASSLDKTLASFFNAMIRVTFEDRALNQLWKSAVFHTIESVLALFGQRRRLGLLGIVVSRKDHNAKNCIAFYGKLRKQRCSKFAIAGKKNTCNPNLRTEYYIEIRRFDNGIPRKSRYLITE